MPEQVNEQKSVVPSSKHFNFHKVFAAIGVILFGTIIVVFATLTYSGFNVAELFQSTPADENTTKVSTDSSKPKATDSAKKDETSNWKTFVSNDFKYSIKYPADWSIIEDRGVLRDVNLKWELIRFNRQKGESENNGKPNFDIGVNLQTGWCENGLGTGPICERSETTIDNVKTSKWTYNSNAPSSVIGNEIYYIESKEIVIFANNNGQKQILDKVLSTFKFL